MVAVLKATSRYLLYVVGAFTLVTGVVLYFLLNSPLSVVYISNYLQTNINGLTLVNPQGTLDHRIQFDRLEYEDEFVTLSADKISIRLNLWCIVEYKACINAFSVDDFSLALKDGGTDPSEPLPSISTPLPIFIKHFDIRSFTLSNAGQTHVVKQINGKVTWIFRRITVDQLTAIYENEEDKSSTSFDIIGKIRLHQQYPLNADITVDSSSNNFNSHIQLEGDLNKLSVTGGTTKPLAAKFQGQIEPLENELPWNFDITVPHQEFIAVSYNDTSIRKITAKTHGNIDGASLTALVHFNLNDKPIKQQVKLAVTASWKDKGPVSITTAMLSQEENIIALTQPWQIGDKAQLKVELPTLSSIGSLINEPLAGNTSGTISLTLKQGAKFPLLDGKLASNIFRYDAVEISPIEVVLSHDNQWQSILASGQLPQMGEFGIDCASLFKTGFHKVEVECKSLNWRPPTEWNLKPWINQKPITAGFDSNTQGIMIDPFCFKENSGDQVEASLCVKRKLQWPNKNLAIETNLNNLPLSRSQYWLPNNTNLKGIVSGQLNLELADTTLAHFSLKAKGSNGELAINNPANNIIIPLRTIELNAQGNPQALQIHAKLHSENYGNADANIHIKGEQEIDGNIKISDLSLASFTSFIPNVHTLEGSANATVSISGSAKAPSMDGKLKLNDVTYKHANYAYPINSGFIEASFNQYRSNFDARFKVNDDPATATGTFDWSADSYQGDINVFSDELHLNPLPHTEIWIAPDLNIRLKPNAMNITGTIDIPKAFIRIDTLPKETIDVSNDATLTDVDSSKDQPFKTTTDIGLTINENVLFRGFGLDTNLSGNLDIFHKTDLPIMANGVVKLTNGTYKAYGQNLSIRSGELLFKGDITNPALRVEAIRPDILDGTMVGVRVAGSANQPQVSLFSQPNMTDQTKLHYLLTGQAPSNTPMDRNKVLSETAVSLGAALGDTSLQDYADSIGIKHFQIGTNNGDAGTEIQLSGYLNPRLYVRYGRGIFEEVNSLTMKYQLTKNLFLESVSSTVNTLDLLWIFKIPKDSNSKSNEP